MIRINQVLSMVLGAFTGLALYDAGRKDGQQEGEIDGYFKGLGDGIGAEPVIVSEGAQEVLNSMSDDDAAQVVEPTQEETSTTE